MVQETALAKHQQMAKPAAEVLHNLGYRVQGSDLADSANVRRLIDRR